MREGQETKGKNRDFCKNRATKGDKMPFKFEQLEIWKLSIQYIDKIYTLAERLPKQEEYNLKSQIIRAATSISLNIAEGSTGQSNPEQVKFLGYALRSLLETVACVHLIRQRAFPEIDSPDDIYRMSELLAAKLHSMRKSLQVNRKAANGSSS